MAMHHGPVTDAFILNDLALMVKVATLFEDKALAEEYQNTLDKLRKKYKKKYIKRDGTMKDDYQGAYVLALQYALDKEDPLCPSIYQKLVERLRRDGIGTGFFATEYLLPLLAEHGDSKFAYDLLLQEECPGWMYQVNLGATTIWERWNAILEDGNINEEHFNADNMVSFNHYAFGSVGEFYYRYILGIQELLPGFAKILLKPIPDKRLGEVKGSYASVQGIIKSAWKYDGEEIQLDFEVPCDAQIVLPDGTIQEVTKGAYHYVCKEALL